MNIIKFVTIKDYLKVPYKDTYLQAPLTKVALTNEDLRLIMHSEFVPVHIYAINPKDNSLVRLTKTNYMKSVDELFNIKEEVASQDISKNEDDSKKVEAFKSLFNKKSETRQPEPVKEEVSVEESQVPVTEEIVEDVKTVEEDVKDEESSDTSESSEPVKEEVSVEESQVAVTEEAVEEVKTVEEDVKDEEESTKAEETHATMPVESQNYQKNQQYQNYSKKNKKKR